MQAKKKLSFLPAYGIIIPLVFLYFFSTHSINAQEFSKLDSINTGVSYKIILFDDTEIIGRVISYDSETVTVSAGLKKIRILKDDIFNISKNLVPSKYRFIFSASGGISFLTGKDLPYSSYSPMYNFSINAAFIAGKSKGYRIDAGYSRFKKKPDNQLYTDLNGGDMDMLYFKTEMMIGYFNPSLLFTVYGTVGLGIHFTRKEEYSYKYNGLTVTIGEEKNTNAVISAGGGFGYRFNKHLGIFSEIQYNIVTNKDRSFLFGLEAGYFPVRAGLTYFIY